MSQVSKTFATVFCCITILLIYLQTGNKQSFAKVQDENPKTELSSEKTFFEALRGTDAVSYDEQKREEKLIRKNDLVVYNRVPKCGSSTMLKVISTLKEQLNYTVFNDIEPKLKHFVENDESERELVEKIVNLKRPMLYIRHIFFLRFTKFDKPDPIYINIVRDPVDLFISNYYYLRFGFSGKEQTDKTKKWRKEMSDEKREMSIDECLRRGENECLNPYSNLIPFFCGSSVSCRKRDSKALELAKKNIERHYLVVGLTEDLETTIRAFETLVPQFFAGASAVYNEIESELHIKTKTKNRIEPEPETLTHLRTKLKLEYELYDFVRELFYTKVKNMKETGLWKTT